LRNPHLDLEAFRGSRTGKELPKKSGKSAKNGDEQGPKRRNRWSRNRCTRRKMGGTVPCSPFSSGRDSEDSRENAAQGTVVAGGGGGGWAITEERGGSLSMSLQGSKI